MMNTKMMNAMDLLNEGTGYSGVVAKAIGAASLAVKILDTLEASDRPLRISEIQNCGLKDYTCQRISAITRQLVAAGAVRRIETDEKEFVPIGRGDLGKMLPIVKFAKV